jgi:hypothetical protein
MTPVVRHLEMSMPAVDVEEPMSRHIEIGKGR